MLAARAHGRGTCSTGLHLFFEEQAAVLLYIPSLRRRHANLLDSSGVHQGNTMQTGKVSTVSDGCTLGYVVTVLHRATISRGLPLPRLLTIRLLRTLPSRPTCTAAQGRASGRGVP